MPQLISLTDLTKLAAAGLPFTTECQARFAARRAKQHGTSEAFVRVGRRIFIDPDRYHELVRAPSKK